MTDKSTFIKMVAQIQKELKAPKNQRNTFGKYNYRNQEDILEAVKPLLAERGFVLTVNDEIIEIGGRVYVKSTATITDGSVSISNSAFAREAIEQKGMADAQLTGATSSYARKYALNGLFLIDDTKDADSDEVTAKTRGEQVPEKTTPKVVTPASIAGATLTAKDVTTNIQVMAANPENNVTATAGAASAVTATPAPVKKSGPWGKKVDKPATTSGGDLY